MALINTLNDIGNAIRGKTGGTELIPLKEMASAIQGISSGDYDNGYADGVASVPNLFEYATDLRYTYLGSSFPIGYELNIKLPIAINLGSCFMQTKGLKKVSIEGNESGNTVNFQQTFRSSEIEEIDLTNYKAVISSLNDCFYSCNKLVKILGILDFENVTSITKTTFGQCVALEEMRVKENTLKVSLNLSSCSALSSETVQSIINGLATVETEQTLTLNGTVSSALSNEQVIQITNKNWVVQ